MTKLEPNEVELTGNWIFENGRMRGDATSERIEWLIKNQLKKLSVTSGGWETLYVDPLDERYWERTYPHGEMHGGGPPKLTMLSLQQAKAKYQFS
jgi:hypothetical protein